MVDVSAKFATERIAVAAEGCVAASKAILQLIVSCKCQKG